MQIQKINYNLTSQREPAFGLNLLFIEGLENIAMTGERESFLKNLPETIKRVGKGNVINEAVKLIIVKLDNGNIKLLLKGIREVVSNCSDSMILKINEPTNQPCRFYQSKLKEIARNVARQMESIFNK